MAKISKNFSKFLFLSIFLSQLSSQLKFSEAAVAKINKANSISTSRLRFQDPFCPTPESLTPCKCSPLKKLWIQCQGVKVTQRSIDKTLDTLRKFNGLRPNQVLTIQNMTIEDTLMTQLDLSPLNLTRMDSLVISHNIYLIELIGPESNVTLSRSGIRKSRKRASRGKIDVKNVDFSSNSLTDEGLIDAFKYLNPRTLERLNLGGNGIQGSLIKAHEDDDDAQGEFLPGLSNLRNLRYLNLSWNAIDEISGGPFRMNNKLIVLSLANNRIDRIGPNAFAFEEASAELSEEDYDKAGGREISIYLNYNQLSKISQESGLESLTKTTKLYLEGNQFKSISYRTFKEFLNKDSSSFVDLKRNPIVCEDRKSRWVRREKAGVRRRVKNAVCSDDSKETVFTTDLI